MDKESKQAFYERGPALLEAYGDCLTDRERGVLSRRLNRLTQVAIATEYGIAIVRVRDIEEKARRKLLTAERVQQKRSMRGVK